MPKSRTAALRAGLHVYKSAARCLFPQCCRFYPSCSEFAAQAVEKYGLLRAIPMTLGRLLRCNPFSAGGFDPVP